MGERREACESGESEYGCADVHSEGSKRALRLGVACFGNLALGAWGPQQRSSVGYTDGKWRITRSMRVATLEVSSVNVEQESAAEAKSPALSERSIEAANPAV